MTKLLPCPFCGHQTHWIEDIYEDEERRFYVFCNACGAMGAWKCTAKEAIEAWNTRAERTCKMVLHSEGCEQWFTCSECGTQPSPTVCMDMPYLPKYCPECGARVIGD